MSFETWLAFAGPWAVFAGFPGPNAAHAMTAGSRLGIGASLRAVSIALSFVIHSGYSLAAARMTPFIRTRRQAMIRNRLIAGVFAGRPPF